MYTAICFISRSNGVVLLTCFTVIDDVSNDIHITKKLLLPTKYNTLLECIKKCEQLLNEEYFIFPDKVIFYVRKDQKSSASINELEGTRTIGIDGREVYRNYNLMEASQFDTMLDLYTHNSETNDKSSMSEMRGIVGWGLNVSCQQDQENEFVGMRVMKKSDSLWFSATIDSDHYWVLVSSMPFQGSSSIMKVAFYLTSPMKTLTIGSFLLDFSITSDPNPPYLLLFFLNKNRKALVFRLVNTVTFTNDKFEYDIETSQSSDNFKRYAGTLISFTDDNQPPDILHDLRMPNSSIFLYYGDLQSLSAPQEDESDSELPMECGVRSVYPSEAPYRADTEPEELQSNWRRSKAVVMATGRGIAFNSKGETLYHGSFAQNRYDGEGYQVNPANFTHHEMRGEFIRDMPVSKVDVVDQRTGCVTLCGVITDLQQHLVSGELFLMKTLMFRGYLQDGKPIAGTLLYSNGRRKYMGRMCNGQASGNGYLYYCTENGDECIWYEGEFKDGMMEGRGKLFLADGKNTLVYDGEFAGNELHGKGTLYLKDLMNVMKTNPEVKKKCSQLRNVDVEKLHGDVLTVRFDKGMLDYYNVALVKNKSFSVSDDIYCSESES